MGIKHEDVKSTGDMGLASEWNKDHVIDSDVECGQHQHKEHVIENRINFPVGPVEGQIIYRTDENRLYVYDGANWQETATNPMEEDFDMDKNEIVNLKLEHVAAFPGAPVTGQVVERGGKFYIYTGTGWQTWTAPATVVVASDGTGDFLTIQEGIDDLPALGGVVTVRDGTYDIDVAIDIDKNNVMINGSGYSTQITTDDDIDMITANNHGKIVLSNLRIVGSGVGNANNDGIHITNGEGIILNRIWVEDCGNYGIYFGTTIESKISDSWVDSNNSVGIYIDGSDKSLISGCFIESNGGHGVRLSSDYCIITSCHILSNITDGIYVDFSHWNSITSCEIRLNGDSGINATGSFYNHIVGNAIQNNTNNGIKLLSNSNQNVISSNVINDHNGAGNVGVNIVAGAPGPDKTALVGNVIQNNTTNLVDGGANTMGNGAWGTNNLAYDDLNIVT